MVLFIMLYKVFLTFQSGGSHVRIERFSSYLAKDILIEGKSQFEVSNVTIIMLHSRHGKER